MDKPKLMYYNDARHYSFYRYDPPMSLHQLRQPVDEVLGTGVDTLVYGLASGNTFLHDSQVGAKWGEDVVEHNHGVMWWRAAENLNQALAAGHDPLQVVVERAHEKGVQVLCSMRMNDGSAAENIYMMNRLKREHPEVMIGEQDPHKPSAATCMDFAHPLVRQERLQMVEEVCGRYGADGLEMDPYVGVFFKRPEIEKNTPLLTEFVRQARQILDRIGAERGQKLCLATRVHPVEEANLRMGMDVRTWLEEGLVDLVVTLTGGFQLDQELEIGWLVEAAQRSGAWIYAPMGQVPYDDRNHKATIEMMRAAASNFCAAGVDGLYVADIGWPLTERQYLMLREMGDPAIYARKNKHYFAAHREAQEETFAPLRYLPVELEEGVAARVVFNVADDLEAAQRDNELERVTLGVRLMQHCPEDEVIFQFNGETLELGRVSHFYGGLVAYTAQRSGLPHRIDTHHWFHFDLPFKLVRRGENEVVVTLERLFKPLVAARVLHQVELEVVYKEPFVPHGGQI